MLSNEEKKSVDLLNYYTGQYINCPVEDGEWDCCREEAEKTILNLIEKQQKEIEYLKGIAKKFNEGTNLNDTEMDYVIKIYERKNNG